MVKRAGKSSGENGFGGDSESSPPHLAARPPDPLHVTMTTLAAGEVLHRVHRSKYKSDQFNPGGRGDARFSPLQDEHGQPVPTLYAGTTMACALMETVFHDVPHVPGLKNLDKSRLADHQHSTIEVRQDVQLADLGSVALRKLGIRRNQLIDTETDQYPSTREWAETLRRKCPGAQGLSWVSRQDDSARAFVFFGDRVRRGTLRQRTVCRNLVEDGDAFGEVLELAERIGVNLTFDES